MSGHKVDFYFDYISPYAYLAWHRAKAFALEHDVELRPEPVLLAAMLSTFGHKGPAEIPPKRVFVFKDVVRQARKDGLPLQAPASHPFNPVLALRATYVAEERAPVVDALFAATWEQCRDVSDEATVRAVLDDAGLDGGALIERSKQLDVKAAFKEHNAEAMMLGVFGVPTFVVGDEVLWGSDQLPIVLDLLEGREDITPEEVDAFLHVEPSATRPKG